MQGKTDGALTRVSTVQTWECDSNNPPNVQVFHQLFHEADYLFRQRNRLGGSRARSAQT